MYVYLRPRFGIVHETDCLESGCIVDYDADGQVLGVEYLMVSDGIDLSVCPERETVRRCLAQFALPIRSQE